jgi:hypothetical protein
MTVVTSTTLCIKLMLIFLNKFTAILFLLFMMMEGLKMTKSLDCLEYTSTVILKVSILV